MKVLVFLLILAGTGCVTSREFVEPAVSHSGTSEIQDFQPAQQDTHSQSVSKPPIVLPPSPQQRFLPEYPADALEREVSCVAKILFHVETSGEATLVRLDWKIAPPPEFEDLFESAIERAVSNWLYRPAIRVDPQKMADGSTEPKYVPIPRAQHAFVRFKVVDGKGVVE